MNVGQSAMAARGWERNNTIAKLKQRKKVIALFNGTSFPFGVPFLLTKNVLPGLLVSEKHATPCFGSPAILLADSICYVLT